VIGTNHKYQSVKINCMSVCKDCGNVIDGSFKEQHTRACMGTAEARAEYSAIVTYVRDQLD
jgi:hypothetical protein